MTNHSHENQNKDDRFQIEFGSESESFDKDLEQTSTEIDNLEFNEDDVPNGLGEYQNKVVAFIDILGFSELIKKSAGSGKNADISRIVSALRTMERQQQNLPSEITITSFSDCIVLSAPDSEEGFKAILLQVWNITKDWLSKGFLCRGGISIGQLIHTEAAAHIPSIVFGPAFLEAYRIETDISNYPRVVLSKHAREKIDQFKAKGFDRINPILLVRACTDGPCAIDLFSHLRHDGFDLKISTAKNEALQFNQVLIKHLNDSKDIPHHFSKVKWLIDQFNESINDTDSADLLISF